jgi:hypothetical protein
VAFAALIRKREEKMNDLTTDELGVLVSVFERAGIAEDGSVEGTLFKLVKSTHSERLELESMDFDDCAGGACKL